MSEVVHENLLGWMNIGNFAAYIQMGYLEKVKDIFVKDIVALEVGSAYGGGVETMAAFLRGKGKVYGYDTFEGHPRDLSDDPESTEAKAMERWYKEYGEKKLRYKYQRNILDAQALDNAILVKGRVNKHSFDDIEKAHLVMLDMDLIKPMKIAYYALKDKIVKGGFLLIHDALPPEHLPLIYKFVYGEVVRDKMWRIDREVPPSNLTVLEKI